MSVRKTFRVSAELKVSRWICLTYQTPLDLLKFNLEVRMSRLPREAQAT